MFFSNAGSMVNSHYEEIDRLAETIVKKIMGK